MTLAEQIRYLVEQEVIKIVNQEIDYPHVENILQQKKQEIIDTVKAQIIQKISVTETADKVTVEVQK